MYPDARRQEKVWRVFHVLSCDPLVSRKSVERNQSNPAYPAFMVPGDGEGDGGGEEQYSYLRREKNHQV